MKRKFWNATWSTFKEEFVDNMRQFRGVGLEAAKYLMNYP